MSAINEGREIRCRAETMLLSACRTLLTTSPDVVSALSVSIPRREVGDVDDWETVARELAQKYELCVEVSTPRGDLFVRFSRHAQDGHNGR